MCGIFGILSKHNFKFKDCVKALKKLEYRGYDSAGVAYMMNSNIEYLKKKGKINNLERFKDDFESNMFISHTRWATHGKPSDVNSHPHLSMDNSIALVHNGVIENYEYLKKKLINLGYHFKSETDSEVLVNFIHYINKKNPESDFVSNLSIALKLVTGAFGILIINNNYPNKMFIAKKGSPISIGMSKDSFFISSDYYSFAEYTKDVLYLNDNEIAQIDCIQKNMKDCIKIHNFTNNLNIKLEFQKIEIDLIELEKETFSHFMLKEIMKQKQSLNDCFRGRIIKDEANYSIKLGGLETLYHNIPIIDILTKAKHILICACGTSLHSAYLAKYIIEELADISVLVEQASEFRYRKLSLPEGTIGLFISQSGETKDTLEALRLCKSKELLTIGICNIVGSSISRESHGGIYLHIGPEIGVASTKAFTAQIGVLYLLALKLAINKKINLDKVQKIIEDMFRLPDLVEKTISDLETECKDLAKIYKFANNFLFLGRGYNYPIALEGALKLKEISYIHAEGYSASEMKHGPIALIDRMMPVVIICTQDKIYEKVKTNLEEVKARGGSIIIITNKSNQEFKENVLKVPDIDEILYPFLTTIPLQLISYYIALGRGCNVDQPRNLAKCVTVE